MSNKLVFFVACRGPWASGSECSTGLDLSVFRALRLLRLLYTLPSRSMQQLLSIVYSMVDEIAAVLIIFLLFLYTATLLGMSYFGDRLDRCLECTN